ncbi:MAG: S9 family peptidase [Xanthomonadales bacterium]|nr:S9 family peptidase [Xanthomonadales bacterium]
MMRYGTPALLAGALLLGATLLSTTPLQADETPELGLSLEETITLRRVSRALISPNGDRVAYTLAVPRTPYVDEDGGAWSELHVVDTDGNSRSFAEGKVSVSGVNWAPDGSALYFSGKLDAAMEQAAVYRMPIDGGGPEVLFTPKTGIGSMSLSPDGTRLAYLASAAPDPAQKKLAKLGFNARVYEESTQVTQLWLLDLDSETTQALAVEGSVSDFAWSPDGERIALALAPTPQVDDELMRRDIVVVSADGGKELSRMGHRGKLGGFAFSPDGERLAWIGGENIHDPSAGRLYVAPSTGGESSELVPNYLGQVEDFYWRDADSIAWLGSRGVWSERRTVRLDSPSAPSGPVSPGPIVRTLDAQAGQGSAAAVVDSPAHPPEVYLINADGSLKRLTNSNPWLSERQLARQEAIRYTARDGLELDAIAVYPEGRVPRSGAPTVMVVHGGPEAHYSNGWLDRYAGPAQHMAADGYLLVYANYRGSTGRGVEFSKASQNDYAGPEFNDIVDAKQHFVALGLADPERTAITGGSYGGYASMWGASALTEHFAAAVAFVGISDQISKFGTTDIPNEMFNVHARAWPWEDWMWMLERSPIFYAGQVETPLLILHGEKDTRVHPSQSLEMYRNVKVRTDTPVRLVYYPNEGHGNRRAASQMDYALRLKRWLDHFMVDGEEALPAWEIDHAARMMASGGQTE